MMSMTSGGILCESSTESGVIVRGCRARRIDFRGDFDSAGLMDDKD